MAAPLQPGEVRLVACEARLRTTMGQLCLTNRRVLWQPDDWLQAAASRDVLLRDVVTCTLDDRILTVSSLDISNTLVCEIPEGPARADAARLCTRVLQAARLTDTPAHSLHLRSASTLSGGMAAAARRARGSGSGTARQAGEESDAALHASWGEEDEPAATFVEGLAEDDDSLLAEWEDPAEFDTLRPAMEELGDSSDGYGDEGEERGGAWGSSGQRRTGYPPEGDEFDNAAGSVRSFLSMGARQRPGPQNPAGAQRGARLSTDSRRGSSAGLNALGVKDKVSDCSARGGSRGQQPGQSAQTREGSDDETQSETVSTASTDTHTLRSRQNRRSGRKAQRAAAPSPSDVESLQDSVRDSISPQDRVAAQLELEANETRGPASEPTTSSGIPLGGR